jgi:hypothetical protein
MTTLELIAFLEYLENKYYLNLDHIDFEKTAIDFQKQQNKPEWTDKFFPPTTHEK